MGDAAGDGLGLVEDGVGAHVQHLIAGRLLPAGHTGTVQVDLGQYMDRNRATGVSGIRQWHRGCICGASLPNACFQQVQ